MKRIIIHFFSIVVFLQISGSTLANTLERFAVNHCREIFLAHPGTTIVGTQAAPGTSLPTKVNQRRPQAWQNIKHIVIIMLENTNGDDAVDQPFLKSLTKKGAYLAQSYGIAHPSQPNYIALIAGSTLGVSDDRQVTIEGRHLGNLLNAKGLSWKVYAENLPASECFLGMRNGSYVRKHQPFISFKNVQDDLSECRKIVSADQFFRDIAASKLPAFSLYIPNLKHDGHDTGIAYADEWLNRTFASIFNDDSITANTLFIITFDEDNFTAINRIYTAFVGAGVLPGAASHQPYTHYSVLRTVEEIFELGSLGRNDEQAACISDIWQP